MFEVQKHPCKTCVYRKDTRLDINGLEDKVKDDNGDVQTFRVCHHSNKACCKGFWDRNKNKFNMGRLAQRLNAVTYVTHNKQV